MHGERWLEWCACHERFCWHRCPICHDQLHAVVHRGGWHGIEHDLGRCDGIPITVAVTVADSLAVGQSRQCCGG